MSFSYFVVRCVEETDTILANSDPTSHDFFTKLAILLPDRSVIPDNGRFILDMFNVLLPVSYTHLDVYKRQLL